MRAFVCTRVLCNHIKLVVTFVYFVQVCFAAAALIQSLRNRPS
jgi:hypothetical protein